MTEEEVWVRFVAAAIASGEDYACGGWAGAGDDMLEAYKARFDPKQEQSPATMQLDDDGSVTMRCDTGVIRIDEVGIYVNGKLLADLLPPPGVSK